jgi:hypothetical protein
VFGKFQARYDKTPQIWNYMYRTRIQQRHKWRRKTKTHSSSVGAKSTKKRHRCSFMAKKIYYRHHELVDRYEISISHTVIDFYVDLIFSLPPMVPLPDLTVGNTACVF